MNDKLKPALIGGVLLGILSAIPVVDYCCCLWAIAGGVLAASIYIKQSPAPVTPADGAVLGAIAGGLGVVLILIIGIPLRIVMGAALMSVVQGIIQNANPEQAAQMDQMMGSTAMTVGRAIGHGLLFSVVAVIFSTIGGLIGVAIFEKRKGAAGAPPPPPPPSGFGGPGM
ncbi:MAG: hypothetical protein M3444_03215 [Acidobacteriota bacterium]|nr:hypothetical protein [Acidobacteriota bacterium]MDQ5835668.1 hypothetical protein [Acidobacteriota bacterium]